MDQCRCFVLERWAERVAGAPLLGHFLTYFVTQQAIE